MRRNSSTARVLSSTCLGLDDFYTGKSINFAFIIIWVLGRVYDSDFSSVKNKGTKKEFGKMLKEKDSIR